MPNYKCKNEDCVLYDIVKARDTRLHYDTKRSKMIDTGSICPECNKKCNSIKSDGYCTTIHSFNVPNN